MKNHADKVSPTEQYCPSQRQSAFALQDLQDSFRQYPRRLLPILIQTFHAFFHLVFSPKLLSIKFDRLIVNTAQNKRFQWFVQNTTRCSNWVTSSVHWRVPLWAGAPFEGSVANRFECELTTHGSGKVFTPASPAGSCALKISCGGYGPSKKMANERMDGRKRVSFITRLSLQSSGYYTSSCSHKNHRRLTIFEKSWPWRITALERNPFDTALEKRRTWARYVGVHGSV